MNAWNCARAGLVLAAILTASDFQGSASVAASPVPERDGGRRLPVVDADPATPAGRILARVVEALNRLMAENPDLDLRMGEPVAARMEGGDVVVEFRGVEIRAARLSVALGDIDLTVTPEGDGLYAFDVDLPQRIGIAGTRRNIEAEITYGAASLHGLFRAETPGLSDVTLSVEDLVVADGCACGTPALTLDELSVDLETRMKGGRLDRVFSAEIADLGAGYSDTKGHLRIDRIRILGEAEDVDRATAERLAAGSDGRSQPVLDLLADNGWGQLSSSLGVEGLEIRQHGAVQAALGLIDLRLEADHADGPVQVVTTLDVEDFQAPGLVGTAELSAAVPEDLIFWGQLYGLPLKEIATRLRDGAEAKGSPGGVLRVLEGIAKGLMAADPVRLKTTLDLAGPVADLSSHRALSLDHRGGPLYSGAFTFRVDGLEKLETLLRNEAGTNPDLAGALRVLVLLRGLGEPEEGDRMRYRVGLDPRDGVTVNGTPWRALSPRDP